MLLGVMEIRITTKMMNLVLLLLLLDLMLQVLEILVLPLVLSLVFLGVFKHWCTKAVMVKISQKILPTS